MPRSGCQRVVKLVLAVVAAATLVGGCGSSTSGSEGAAPTTAAPAAQRGGRLVYGTEADPNGLDPTRNTWDPSAILIAGAIYDPLGAFDENGVIRPYLLASIEHNPDFTRWTATMRPGVKFHNGEVANADALAVHINALVASAITGPAATNVDRVEKVDDLTVNLYTKRPWSSLPAIFTGQAGMLAAPAQLADPKGSVNPVGTGPFKLADWQVGTKLSVVRNPDYWRQGLPYLDEVQFIPSRERGERVDKLADGTYDAILANDPASISRLDQLAADGKVQVIKDAGNTEPNMIMFNTASPALADPQVRRGLAYATDVEALARTNGWAPDRLADGPFVKTSPWYAPVAFPRNDPVKAKELLGAATRSGPLEFKLLTWPDPQNLALAQSIIEQWAPYGVKVTVETTEFKSIVIRAVTGQYDAVIFRYFGQPDPESLTPFWISETVRPVGALGLNFSRLGDEQIDEALWAARATDDRDGRKAALTRIQQRQAELVPYIWLYFTDWAVAARTNVHDLTNQTLPDGTRAMPLQTGIHRLTDAWIER